MLKALPVFVLSLIVGTISGQITLTTDYLPEVGDSLKFSYADSNATVDLIGVGGPHEWDFTALTAVRTSEQYFVDVEPGTQDDAFPNANAKVVTGELSTNYYQISANQVNLIGNIGSSDLVAGFEVATPFSPPYVERRAPLSFIDQFTTVSNISVAVHTDSLPAFIIDAAGDLLNAADSLRFRTMIDRDDLVDAYGTVALGDQIYDVLRERRNEVRSVTIEAYNFLVGWVDITAGLALAIPQLGELFELQDTVTSYTFWSNASVDPIAVVSTEADGSTITGITFKTLPTASSVDDDFLPSTQVKMYPNPARTNATFEATGLPRGQYELRIHNVIGRKMIGQTFNVVGSNLRSDIDVSRLPSGLYLYSLINSRGRILATKRLFVGGGA